MIRGIGFREQISIRILTQDNGLSNHGRFILFRVCNAFSTGIENQFIWICDRFPYQMTITVGNSGSQYCTFAIQRFHFKFCTRQCFVCFTFAYNLLQIYRGDNCFINHGQHGILDGTTLRPITSIQSWCFASRPDIKLRNNFTIFRGSTKQLEVDVFRWQIAHRCLAFVEGIDGIFLQCARIHTPVSCSIRCPGFYRNLSRGCILVIHALVDFQCSTRKWFSVQTLLITGFGIVLNIIPLGNGDYRLFIFSGQFQSIVFPRFRNNLRTYKRISTLYNFDCILRTHIKFNPGFRSPGHIIIRSLGFHQNIGALPGDIRLNFRIIKSPCIITKIQNTVSVCFTVIGLLCLSTILPIGDGGVSQSKLCTRQFLSIV